MTLRAAPTQPPVSRILGCRRAPVPRPRLRRHFEPDDHRRSAGEPRRGQLPLRREGRAVPGHARAAARPAARGAARAARRVRAVGRREAALVRAHPRRALRARARPRARRRAAAVRTSSACSAARTSTRRRRCARSCPDGTRRRSRASRTPSPGALPHIAARELAWRLHFMLGALAYTLAGTDAWTPDRGAQPRGAGERPAAPAPARAVPDRRVAGTAAGPRAPRDSDQVGSGASASGSRTRRRRTSRHVRRS